MVLKILMVDDHALILESYKTVLQYCQNQHEIQATLAYNCQDAFNIISHPNNIFAFDLVILDYSLPPFSEQKIENGEDLGLMVRKFMSKTKIIMLTSHSDSIKIYNLFFNVRPDGILIKSDIGAEQLIDALNKIVTGKSYYSPKAISCINESFFANGQINAIDRQIIVLTSFGYKIKTIAKSLNITEVAVKKRKQKIKELLNLNNCGDENLLEKCRSLNLLPS